MSQRFKSVYCILFFCCSGCMPQEDLPIRDVGNALEYFIECYCKPGKVFALTATNVLPVSEDLELDFSKEMAITIRADRDIRLFHTIYTLPGSDFVYNYGTNERWQRPGMDSLFLSIVTNDNQKINGSTAIPPDISIYNYELREHEATIRFYTSEHPADNYYIYSAEAIRNDSIISKQTCYLDYSEYYSGGLAEKSVILSEVQKAEKVIFNLKRITRANYDYQISLNAANTANQSSITTPVPLKGNLKGALGIFTCYTEDRAEIKDFSRKIEKYTKVFDYK